MSYMATLVIRPNGDVVGAGEEYECRNASLAGPVAWRSIGEKYLGPYHWQTGYRDDTDRRPNEAYAERAWRLKDDRRIEFHDWTVLHSTFDYFACKLEHMEYLADAFRKFHAEDLTRKNPERLPSHYGTLADHLRRILDNHATSTKDEVMGVAYYMHSCGCIEWQSKTRGRDNYRPYNVKKDKGHWWWNPADYAKRGQDANGLQVRTQVRRHSNDRTALGCTDVLVPKPVRHTRTVRGRRHGGETDD